MKDILLTTINAKWIHPSLALRLLKANLGELEDNCEIIEFALRQPLAEKVEALSVLKPKILGISVSIWNHTATLELLRSLIPDRLRGDSHPRPLTPVIIMGGPEVSHLPQDAEIFKYADYVIRGEGEIAFRELCGEILSTERLIRTAQGEKLRKFQTQFINAEPVDVNQIKTAYHLYTDEDVKQKLVYVESSRGCPFGCEFCISSRGGAAAQREFALKDFLSKIDILITRGVKTFKFLDRTFNLNIKRAIQICEVAATHATNSVPYREPTPDIEAVAATPTFHFEMVPTLITPELVETLSRFPPGSLRLEIGIQTLNPEVASRIGLPGRACLTTSNEVVMAGKTSEEILAPLRILREKTNAIIHADLIAGLPGEDLESFAKGFDLLYDSLRHRCGEGDMSAAEIQLGILKLLPGAPIARHNEEFKMRYNSKPPYEVMETSAMSAEDITRLKNFARFWEVIVNRININVKQNESVFNKFMKLSDELYAHFGRNWGIDKKELLVKIDNFYKKK